MKAETATRHIGTMTYRALRVTVTMRDDEAAFASFQIDHLPGDGMEADPVADGHIKWDGCANWSTLGNAHFCDPDGADALASAIRAAYTLASEMIDRFDIEAADLDDGWERPALSAPALEQTTRA